MNKDRDVFRSRYENTLNGRDLDVISTKFITKGRRVYMSEKNGFARSLWRDRFKTAYDMKWKSRTGKNTQEDFATALTDLRNERGLSGRGTCTGQQVSKWLRGENIPNDENIGLICEILDLDESYFEPTRDEKYTHSAQYITELGRSHIGFSNEIGLDLNLVKALHDLIDFGSDFPLYTPIRYSMPQVSAFFTDEVIVDAGRGEERWDLKDSAMMGRDKTLDLDLDFLQMEKNGKRITFSKPDLAYLREVQDQVVQFVKYLFYMRSREMDEEVEKVKEQVKSTVEVTKTADGGTRFAFGVIPEKEMITSVDRFAKYVYTDAPEEGGSENGEH